MKKFSRQFLCLLFGITFITAAPARAQYTNTMPIQAVTALAFDGVDDFTAAAGTLALSNASFSIQVWVRSFRPNTDQFLLAQGVPATSRGLTIGYRLNNRFTFAFGGNDLDTVQAYPDSGWHHWSCTFNAATRDRRLYRDGIPVANDVASAAYQGTGTFYLGAAAMYGSHFHGHLDEARIWNRVLTPAEITANYNQPLTGNESGLIAYWRCDERAGTTVADSTGLGHTLTFGPNGNTNGPNWIASTAFPAWTPSGDWRELKLRWPLHLDGTVSPIYSNGSPFYFGMRPAGLQTLAQYQAGQYSDYRSNAWVGHNGLDISLNNYRQVNNDAAKVYAAAGGILYAWRDGHEYHAGGADQDAATAASMQVNLAGWWRFNEGSGTNVTDTSTNQLNGFILGTNWARVTDPQRGQVLQFGGDASVTITNPVIRFDRAYTLSAWVQTTESDAHFIAKSDGDKNWEPGEKLLYVCGPASTSAAQYGAVVMEGWGAGYAFGRRPVNDGKWHHVAFVFDPVSWQRTVYVDGQPDVASPHHSPVADNPGDWLRLAWSPHSGNFIGQLDDVAVYRGALSQAQIQSVMAGNAVPTGPARGAFTQWAAYPEKNIDGIENGSGNCVMLQHPNGMLTAYAHLKTGIAITNQFRTGDWVPAGTLLGIAASSGASSGTHLHFGVVSGPENQNNFPEIFHPTLRTNTGLSRYARIGNLMGIVVEPFFEEPGTGESMWDTNQILPVYRPDQNAPKDITDMAISTAPVFASNPADNITAVPLHSDIYVAPYEVYGAGFLRYEMVNPLGQTNVLTTVSDLVPSFRASMAGEYKIYSYRRLLETDPWQGRSSNSFTVFPALLGRTFSGSPVGTVFESAADTGIGGTIDAGQLRIGDDSTDRASRAILSFNTSALPDLREVVYAELRVRLAGVEGINPFERNQGWGGRMFVDVKNGTFGNANLEAADFQSVGTTGGWFNKGRDAGDTMVTILNAAGLAQINRTGTTQFRVWLEVANNANSYADSLSLELGSAELIVYTDEANPTPTLVTSLDDHGPGTLRAAVAMAANLPGPDAITFAPELSGGVIRLTSGQIVIDDATGPVTISAANLPRGLTIDGDSASRVFLIRASSEITLDSLTLTNGYVAAGSIWDGDGGSILSYGKLRVSRCTFVGNRARFGGAVDSESAEAAKALTIENSTFTQNSAIEGGGAVLAIYSFLHHSTFTGNRAHWGGGLALWTLTMSNCVIAGNSTTLDSPDIYKEPGYPWTNGFNFVGDGDLSLLTNGLNGNVVGNFGNPANPMLGSLRPNGGLTPTVYPLPGSPLINSGSPDVDLGLTDQRGQPRVWSGRAEIGAVEFVPSGNSLLLDGVDDYVILNDAGLSLPTNEITVEFWERVETVRNQFSFILFPDVVTNRVSFSSVRVNLTTYWDVGNLFTSGRAAYVAPSNVDTWTHWALVSSQSGNAMRIYRNGQLDYATATNSSFIPYAGALVLGARLDAPQEFFKGELDEFRIWSVARTQSEIQANMFTGICAPQSNLWVYWKFDEGAGTAAVDYSGNGRHATLVNGATRSESFVPLSAPGSLSLVQISPTQTRLTWQPVAGCLEVASDVNGPWTATSSVTNGQSILIVSTNQFFRLRQ